MKNRINAKNTNGDIIQNSTVNKITALDEVRKLLNNSDYEGAVDLLRQIENFVGTNHPLYPHFSIGFKEVDNKKILYSKPMSKEAIRNYPISIKGNFSLSKKYSTFKSFDDVMQYSYNNQEDIELDDIAMVKMIGHEKDPFQDDLQEMLKKAEGKWKIKHKEFPEARPYKLCFDNSSFSFDYILFRTIKIDGSKVYIDNCEQKTKIYIELMINTLDKSMQIGLRAGQNSMHDYEILLKVLMFYKEILLKRRIKIISLTDNTEFVSAVFDNGEYERHFDMIDDEITFIKKILIIEKKYRKKITIPKEIDGNSYENIFYLSEGIENGKIEGSWNNFSSHVEIDESNKEYWRSIKNETMNITFQTSKKVIIFEEPYIVPQVNINMISAKYYDFDNLERKANVLGLGDLISFKLIPADSDKYIEEWIFDQDFD